jgi:hypothetical protein
MIDRRGVLGGALSAALVRQAWAETREDALGSILSFDPDLLVTRTAADIAAGRDVVLEAALGRHGAANGVGGAGAAPERLSQTPA